MGVNSKKALYTALGVVFALVILAMIIYMVIATNTYEKEKETIEEYSIIPNDNTSNMTGKEEPLKDEDEQKLTSFKILKNYCEYYKYNYKDLKYIGIHNMMGSEFDCYLHNKGYYLLVEVRYPYSIYWAENMSSEAILIWENGEPITSDKKSKIALEKSIAGLSAYEQYVAINLESEGMDFECWRDLGDFQNCDEIIYLEDVYNNFYQCMRSARGDCFVYVMDFEIEDQLKSFGVTPINGNWRWARLSQGIIYLKEEDLRDTSVYYTDIRDSGL